LHQRIDTKIKQIENDIKAIENNEVLGIYKGQTHPKEKEIKFQLWRIGVLQRIKPLPKEEALNELVRLEQEYEKESKYEILVLKDLFAYALGVK